MITIVCGGFFGDEGKGKVAAYLGLRGSYRAAVRTGSVNAGHTVISGGRVWRLRLVPSAFLNQGLRLYIARGSLVRLDVLFREVEETGVRGRLCVDRGAGVIEERHVEAEARDSTLRGIGSTFQGVGAAMSERVMRRLRLAGDFPELGDMVCDSVEDVLDLLDAGEEILAEGTQGLYLSLYHGTYPYVTSRDTSAAGILSEVGAGPGHVGHVIVVFKAYVTRVGEGPLPGELGREEIERLGIVEKGTVTGRLRRAAPFNPELARLAVRINRATQAAVTRIDALYRTAHRVREWEKLPREARAFVEEIESAIKVPVSLIGTGEEVEDMVDRRRELGLL